MFFGDPPNKLDMGKFITFEGGEGAGKSTQISLLAKTLKTLNMPVTTTREPGGSDGAEIIRNLLLDPKSNWDAPTEALLHFAARADHYTTLIRPALKRGEWVISDRFADSTRAYQGYGLGLALEAIEILYQISLGEVEPDLTIILDLPVETGMARVNAATDSPDRYEQMDTEFHQKLRLGFLKIAENNPERCVVIDAASDIPTVNLQICRCISERLKIKIT
ncbi:MAG: dTMP kinase [Pseudomonadota bacterium]|nr:dTMP kinase [Pseudomonadota bacterium]